MARMVTAVSRLGAQWCRLRATGTGRSPVLFRRGRCRRGCRRRRAYARPEQDALRDEVHVLLHLLHSERGVGAARTQRRRRSGLQLVPLQGLLGGRDAVRRRGCRKDRIGIIDGLY